MAHRFARYLSSTHDDPDWAALTTLQHDCYMALVSSEVITWCGVLPYIPARFSSFAADLTPKKVASAWGSLERSGLLVIDKKASEVLVRSFVRHDEVMKSPNLAKAFLRAFGKVRSRKIKDALTTEIARLRKENPDWSGWGVIPEPFPEPFPEGISNKPTTY